MATQITFDKNWLDQLLAKPGQVLRGNLGGQDYTAALVIPDYRNRLNQHYRNILPASLEQVCVQTGLHQPFQHFGVKIKFETAQEVQLYQNNTIEKGLCELIKQVGLVVLQNVYHNQTIRNEGHRNRFPHLQFHIDRSANQETRYSLYTRDPLDEEQRHPRTASTLFIPNITAYLQGIKEGKLHWGIDKGQTNSSQLFADEISEDLLGDIILEQKWNLPEGTGEIAMIDNADVLHASYYRDAERTGYKIGVRYLAGLPWKAA
ncbi:MAG: hypothetical protein OEZ43_14290 [Gammaproteobacteria bacterium]|nr:hypothetical protein [Gammaproteobacteria bacterium]